MRSDEAVIAVALFFVLIALIAARCIGFFVRFNDDTRYITREMRRAYDDDEYRYWRRELRCHYLCLIPFVNEENAGQLYKRLCRKSGHGKNEKRRDGLYHILAPSVIGICICAVCLCGASWAWFTSSQTAEVAAIQAATYGMQLSVSEADGGAEVAVSALSAALEAEKSYTVTLTAEGTAAGGYGRLVFNEAGSSREETAVYYYTPQLAPDSVFTFTVVARAGGTLRLMPQWGTCTVADEDRISAELPLTVGTASTVPLTVSQTAPTAAATTATAATVLDEGATTAMQGQTTTATDAAMTANHTTVAATTAASAVTTTAAAQETTAVSGEETAAE